MQEQRASTIAWQLLDLHTYVADKMTTMTQYLCVGDQDNVVKTLKEMTTEMSKREIYYERYYDHYLFTRTIKRYSGGKEIVDNLDV